MGGKKWLTAYGVTAGVDALGYCLDTVQGMKSWTSASQNTT